MLLEDENFNLVNTSGECWIEKEGVYVLNKGKVSDIEDLPGHDYPAINHFYKQELKLGEEISSAVL